MIEAGTWQADLFRLASLTWSIPVSQGYGRRIRFLVWDDFAGKLLGIIALGDPVFNLRARDGWVGWQACDRKDRLVNVLDAYVLGAIPPYNQLLAGKLVACLIRTAEVSAIFARRYGRKQGVISGETKSAVLSLVTTTSAFGRSSLYNRLRLAGTSYFESLGYTEGFGHFHIPDELFSLIRDYLAANRHEYSSNHQFGDGANWRMRATREALTILGLNPRLMRHGVKREVFACEFFDQAREYLRGERPAPKRMNLPTVAQVGELSRDRWLIPRAQRRPDFLEWRASNIRPLLMERGIAAVPSRTNDSANGTYGAR